jgi:hypothetical protein
VKCSIDRLASDQHPWPQDDSLPWFPSLNQVARGTALFMDHISHAYPFLHQPTFDPLVAEQHLVLAVICLGYHYGEDPDRNERLGSGVELALRCYRRASQVVESNEAGGSSSTSKLVTVQTYLLLQVFAMLYMGGDNCWDGRRMHSTVIAVGQTISCRSTPRQTDH